MPRWFDAQWVILASSAFKELADVGAEDLDRGGVDTVVTTPPAAEVPAYVAVSFPVVFLVDFL